MATRKATKKEEQEIEELEEEEAAEEEEEEEPAVQEEEPPRVTPAEAQVPKYVAISAMSKALTTSKVEISKLPKFNKNFGDDEQQALHNLNALTNVLDVLALRNDIYIPVSPTQPTLNPG